MWSRGTIKDSAKYFLRKHYWKAFLVCLIASIFVGGNNKNSSSNSNSNRNNYMYIENEIIREIGNNAFLGSDNLVINNVSGRIRNSPIGLIYRGITPIIFAIFTIILITVGYVMEVGKMRFFLRGFKGDVGIGNLVSTFNSREYWKIVKTQFLRAFFNLLWYLLLIIPGIIKSYEYSMVPYILAEEPDLDPSEIISRSREITKGHKFDMFVLNLSFLGWEILGSLFFGIGIIFVNPYKEATYAKLYNVLSGNDEIDENISSKLLYGE